MTALTRVLRVRLLIYALVGVATSFTPSSPTPAVRTSGEARGSGSGADDARRQFLVGLPPVAASLVWSFGLATPTQAAGGGIAEILGIRTDEPFGKLPQEQFVDKSGLRYYDYVVGQGPKPAYGQVLRIEWVGYVRTSADNELTKFDSTLSRKTVFLFKHGNGRLVQGLDAGIHTMRVGGARRIILPPALGYTDKGIYGPIPPNPFDRQKLDSLIENISPDTGEVVFDVKLLEAYDDDADPGYYSDLSFSENTMRSVDQRLENLKSLAK